MTRIVICLLFLVSLASSAYASENGEDLLQKCMAAQKLANGENVQPIDYLKGMYCVGYLQGFTDMVGMFPPKYKGHKLICFPPQGISGDQAIRIVVKWLKGHPGTLHKSARAEVLIALSKDFPCTK
jgi:hypothetical protein